MAYDIGPKIGIEGEAEFRKQINDLTTQQKTLATEMQAVSSAFDKNDSSEEKAAARAKVLTQQIEVQKQKLDSLKQGLAAATEKYGENDKVTLGWKQSVNKATTELNNMQRELSESTSESAKLKAEQEKLAKQVSDTSDKLQKSSDAMGSVNKVALAGAAAIGGIAAVAGKTGADFEAQMSRVKAISGATGQEFDDLNKQAVQLGADTAYSATEAAQGMENLASAGFSTSEIMEAMPGMLDLAASSGEDLAASSDIAASTLRGFGLAASDAGHVADVLAKNAANTNAAVADTGAAMKYIAPVAQNAGWSLEQVTAAIGEMADAGIKGEQAGTTLRGALTNLMNPSKEQAAAMKEIGFSAYDANGKMKSLSEIIKELGEKTSGLTNEQKDNTIATIMGTNSLSGMQVLLKDGSTNLDRLTASLKDSNGSADEMAKTMQDNLKGSIEQLGGAAESAGIALYEKFAGKATDAISGLADKVAEFAKNLASGALDQKLSAIAAAAAAAATAVIALNVTLAVKDIMNFISAVQGGKVAIDAYTSATKAGTIAQAAYNLAMSITPLGWFVIALAAVTAAIITLWNTNEGFRNAVIGAWTAIQQTASTVFGAIANFFTVTIPEAWNGLVALFNGIPDWWNGIWQSVGDFFTSIWNSIISFITEKIPEIISNIGQWFSELPYNIGYALGAALAAVVNWCVNTFNTVKTQIPIIINNVIQWFQQLPGRIWAFLVMAITNVGAWCASMLNTVKTQIPVLINSVGTFFSQLPGKIWVFLVDVVNKVVGWCGNLVATAQMEIPKFVAKVVEFIGELPGKMVDIGKNIVHGIWDGITGAIDWLHDKISDFCDGILDGFKKNLKIHSPSVLFADVVGKNIALGIGEGFSDSMTSVAANMAAAVQGLTAGMTAPAWNIPQPAYAGAAGTAASYGQMINYTSIYNSPTAPTPADVNRINRQNAQRIALIARRNR